MRVIVNIQISNLVNSCLFMILIIVTLRRREPVLVMLLPGTRPHFLSDLINDHKKGESRVM